MKDEWSNLKIKQIRVHVGVQLKGEVVTSVDTQRLGCTVERCGQGFLINHKGMLAWVPDTNTQFAMIEYVEPTTRSVKVS